MLSAPSSSPRLLSKNRTTVRSRSKLRLARVALQTAYLVSEDFGAGLAERLFTSPRRFPRPPREQAVLAAGRPFRLDATLRAPRWGGQPRRIAAWRWGQGPAVLLVHGWEGRGAQLGAFVEPLVAAGLSVVAFDAPGHGDSAGHRAYLPDFADALVAVAAAAGPVHATISHSFGAAAVLLAHGRGGLDASRNVMIAPNALIHDSVQRFARELSLDEADRAGFAARLEARTGIPLAALAIEPLAAARDAALLIVHDREDREVPLAHGEALAAVWPGARLEVTSDLGHRRILRDPGVIARAVALVASGAPAPASDLVREVDRQLAIPPAAAE
ncbi:MAG TPA: alpha/beta fold hydrolase [Kofleriaceae bacterium]|nr:alpha/beta fold hydrolase [Kofleriaceae bacterium]